MYLSSQNKSECCGCTACKSVCPNGVIKMVEDEEGFSFPTLNDKEKCISCGLCERVCPMKNFQKSSTSPSCYYAWIKDSEVYSRSTSGGAFSAFCQWAKRKGYSEVYGAGYSDNGIVVHKPVVIEDYLELSGTKYVQSSLGNTFTEIRNKLQNGIQIVFVGTPCQVEGLLKCIGKKYDGLFTISLVCHNTASPKAYIKYMREVGDDVSYIRFRDKRFAEKGIPATTIVFGNGKEEHQIQNPYTTAFGLGLMSRYSCNACPFTTVYRNSDITIGDFWGLEKEKPELVKQCEKGVSLILVHTEKGKNAMEEIGEYLEYTEVDVHLAVNDKQPQLSIPASLNPRRDSFMREILIEDKSFIKTANREINRWKMRNRIKRYLHL